MKYSVTAAEEVPASAPILLRGDFYCSLDDAREIGYRYMEIHLRHAGQVEGSLLKTHCDELGLQISSIGTGMGYTIDKLSLTDNDCYVRKLAVERLMEHIDLAEVFGCGVIIGSMKGFIPAEENYSLYEGFCLEGMKRLADYGGSKGVPLYLEAINRYELNYLNTIDDTLNFLNKINSPAVKILVDTFHMNIEEPDIAQSIINCGQFLGHVHLADSNRHYPGAGHINFEAVIEALKIIGYEGYAALECMAFPSSLEAAKKGLDYLTTLGKVSS